MVLLAGSLGLQLSFDRVIGSDGFFHIRQAERAPFGDMPWMPHSLFADGWVDHQLLFHTLLRPFTWFGDDILGAKVGAAVFAAAAVEAVRRFLRARSVPVPLLWAVLTAGISWEFLLRIQMPRTQALSLVLMLAGMWALIERRPRALFGIAFLYAWTYQVALLLLPIAFLHALVDRRTPGAFRAPLVVAVGLAAGFTIHPQSPDTWVFLYEHVVLKVLNAQELPVGGEWTTGGDLHGATFVALALAGVHLLAVKERSRDAVFLWWTAAVSFVGCLIAVKFVEYSVPLAVIAWATAVRDDPDRKRPTWAPTWVVAVFCAALFLYSGHRVHTAVLETEPPPDRLAAAMAALDAHATPGDIVYHFSWSDFPELVFHGPEYRYIVGLDPHFLALEDPELWDLYSKIERGWGTNPSKPIAERFGARWAVLVLPHEGAEELLGNDPGLRELYRDPHAVVYAVAP